MLVCSPACNPNLPTLGSVGGRPPEKGNGRSAILHDMVGSSARLEQVLQLIAKVAPTDATVLIGGETGTGKELVARAIHRNSLRAGGAFVAINCAAMPEHLLESELFGHTRGAFTGAVAEKKGKLEMADGGTLMLDEIGEMPLALQAKLLRPLQEQEFERLGGTRPIRVNVRILAATNAELRGAIGRGEFRPDLYYRLDVVSVHVPPLRDRREDIPALAAHFVEQSSAQAGRKPPAISAEAQACLGSYDWPGNVRELRHAIERAVVLGTNGSIRLEDLPRTVIGARATPSRRAFAPAVREFKKQLILNAVSESGGCYTAAGAILGMHPNNLHRLIRKLNLKDALRKQF